MENNDDLTKQLGPMAAIRAQVDKAGDGAARQFRPPNEALMNGAAMREGKPNVWLDDRTKAIIQVAGMLKANGVGLYKDQQYAAHATTLVDACIAEAKRGGE